MSLFQVYQLLNRFLTLISFLAEGATNDASLPSNGALPKEWNRKSDHVFGLSDSLYDRNQVTKNRNGEPIADCFGIIARNDSAILALADGVNWG